MSHNTALHHKINQEGLILYGNLFDKLDIIVTSYDSKHYDSSSYPFGFESRSINDNWERTQVRGRIQKLKAVAFFIQKLMPDLCCAHCVWVFF